MLFVCVFAGIAAAETTERLAVENGRPGVEVQLIIAMWTVVLIGSVVVTMSMMQQGGGKGYRPLIAFYGTLAAATSVALSLETIACGFIFAIAALTLIILIAISVDSPLGLIAVFVACIAFVSILPVISVGLQSTFAAFIALVITISYATAKLAKRFGWIDPAVPEILVD